MARFYRNLALSLEAVLRGDYPIDTEEEKTDREDCYLLAEKLLAERQKARETTETND